MTEVGQNFEMFQGDSKLIYINVEDEFGNPLDISTYTVIWVVYKQTSKEAILTKTTADDVTVSGAFNDIAVVSLSPEDTESVAPAVYNHECEISKTSEGLVSTVATGTIKILYSKA